MILADSSVWIHHLRRGDAQLRQLLLQQRIRCSDVVIGELRLGSGLPKDFITDLLALPRLPSPSAVETHTFIDRHHRVFAGSGVGWADAQVILTATRAGARLHTSDKAMRRVCKALRIALVS